MRTTLCIATAVLSLWTAACANARDNTGYRAPSPPTAAPTSQAMQTAPPNAAVQNAAIPEASGAAVATASGLRYIDIAVGSGPAAQAGQNVRVHYTGWLESTGQKFDSSLDRGQPFPFRLGASQVIKGWDEGVASMQVGGKRRLIIPPDLAYGATGNARIPGNSTLIFDVELLGIE